MQATTRLTRDGAAAAAPSAVSVMTSRRSSRSAPSRSVRSRTAPRSRRRSRTGRSRSGRANHQRSRSVPDQERARPGTCAPGAGRPGAGEPLFGRAVSAAPGTRRPGGDAPGTGLRAQLRPGAGHPGAGLRRTACSTTCRPSSRSPASSAALNMSQACSCPAGQVSGAGSITGAGVARAAVEVQTTGACRGRVGEPGGAVGRARQDRLDLVGGELGAGVEQVGDDAAGQRGRHRGAAAEEVVVADPAARVRVVDDRAGSAQRDQVRAGRDQVRLGDALRGRAARGEGRDHVVETRAVAGLVQRADGQQRRVVARGADGGRAGAVVAGRHHDDDPVVPERVEREAQRVELVGDRAAGRQREVQDPDVERLLRPGHGLQAAQHARPARCCRRPWRRGRRAGERREPLRRTRRPESVPLPAMRPATNVPWP